GSRHAWHRRSALHAVALNRDTSSVSVEPHRGHRTRDGGGTNVSGTGPEPWRRTRPGGAIPASASLRRPSAVIQSLDHAGRSTVRTSTRGYPARWRAWTGSSRMVSSAGHPV